MAKIRGVKPDYWTDEDIVDLTIPARLLFIGLWNHACDNGHLQDKPKQIKMRVLPGDDVNVSELLRELADKRRIERVGGVILIPNFTKHQRPDKRYFQTCEAPGCARPDSDSQRETRGGHAEPTTSARSGPTVGSWGPHVDGDGEVKGSDGDRSGADKPRAKRATQLPDDFRPSEKHQALAAEQGVDLRAEWTKFCDHHRAKGSTFKDWNAALNNWIRRAAEYGNVRPLARPLARPQVDEQGRTILPPLPPRTPWGQ